MDTPKPPSKAANLLNDLESIRSLLDDAIEEPPLLTESLDPGSIPLLSDVVERPLVPAGATPAPTASASPAASRPTGSTAPLPQRPPTAATPVAPPPDPTRINRELRAAAQLILQEVIDDYVPQIEAELQRRLEARLNRLLNHR